MHERTYVTLMTTPGDAGESCWGLAYLARRTEGVVKFKVSSDRAGIVLLHWSSTLVLFKLQYYVLICVILKGLRPYTQFKVYFILWNSHYCVVAKLTFAILTVAVLIQSLFWIRYFDFRCFESVAILTFAVLSPSLFWIRYFDCRCFDIRYLARMPPPLYIILN